MTEKTEIFSMEACAHSLELLTVVIRKFVEFMKVGYNQIDVNIGVYVGLVNTQYIRLLFFNIRAYVYVVAVANYHRHTASG